MTAILRYSGADYSPNSMGYRAPVTDGLLGWFYLGALSGDTGTQAQARSLRNLAFNDYTATMVGTPTFATGYAEFDANTNYFQTNIPETLNSTILILAYPNDLLTTTNVPVWVGNYGTDATYGSSKGLIFYCKSSALPFTSPTIGALMDDGGSYTEELKTLTVNPWTSMLFLSAKVNASTGAFSIRNITAGGSASSTTYAGTRTLSSAGRTMRIGSAYATSFAGIGRMGFVAMYNRVLTEDEENAIHTSVAAYRLAKVGDTV